MKDISELPATNFADLPGAQIAYSMAGDGPPLLLLWSDDGFVTGFRDPLAIWQQWCSHVTGQQLAASHFLMEEQPVATAGYLQSFFQQP